MPKGIVLSSASHGATQEAVEAVLAKHGLEVEKPAEAEEKPEVKGEADKKAAEKAEETEKTEETAAAEEEPKRDDFKSEEEFEAAHVDWQDKQPKPKEEEDDEEEEEKPAPKKSRMQRKIERATSEMRRENEELKRRVADLEKGGKKEKEPEAESANPRPSREKFKADGKTDEEYEDALLAWGTEKALADKTAKDAEKAQKQQLEDNLANYREQVEAFKEEHDDWDKVVGQEIPMHTGVQLAIMEQDNAAETTYYLGKHPEYTKRLAEMTPLSAVMEVGRLSERLKTGAPVASAANGTDKTTKPKPRAPAPPTPVSTAATSSTSLTSREIAAKPNYPGKVRDFRKALNAGR